MCCLLLFSDGSQDEDQVIYFTWFKKCFDVLCCSARDKLCCMKVFNVHGANSSLYLGFLHCVELLVSMFYFSSIMSCSLCYIVNITHISSLCYWLWLIKVSLQVILYKIETVMADSFEGLELLSQSFIERIFPSDFLFWGAWHYRWFCIGNLLILLQLH